MKITSYVLPIIALSTLTACGGGGGGSGSASTPPTSINSTVEVNPSDKQSSVQTKGENSQIAEKPPVAESKPEVKPEKPPVVESKPEAKPEQPPVAESKPEAKPEQPPVVESKPEAKPEQPPVVESKPEAKPEQPPMVENKPIEPPKMAEKEVWSGDFPHSKDRVPVVYLVENAKAIYDTDPNISERVKGHIQLKQGINDDPDYNYRFYLLDDNAYYGFYRDTADMRKVDSHFVYGYNETAENKGDLSQLSANYKGQFWYMTRSIANVVTPSKLTLTYENGVAKGEIISRIDEKLFDVSTTDDPRKLLLAPATEFLENSNEQLNVGKDSSDRTIFDIHFINGKDGTENKSLVGKGGNERYWGVLGAEKQ